MRHFLGRRLSAVGLAGALALLGGVAVAAPASAGTPPSSPVGLQAHGNGVGEVRVRWDEPAGGTDPITSYVVTVNPGGHVQHVGPDDCWDGGDRFHEALFRGLDPNGQYTATVVAASASGQSQPATATAGFARPQVGNLVLNPSFETSLTYWSGFKSTLSRVRQAGAPDGAAVAKVARASGTAYTIGDAATSGTVPTIAAAGAGQRVLAVAAVKAASASAVGKPVSVLLRERSRNGTVVKTTRGPVKRLTNQWQEVLVEATASTTGNTVGIAVEQTAAVAGNAFFVDNLRTYGTVGPVMGHDIAGTGRQVLDPDIKRAMPTETGDWSPNVPQDCFLEWPSHYSISSLKAYVDGRGGGTGSQPIRGVVYGPDGGLAAVTQPVSIRAGRAPGWVTLPLTTPVHDWIQGGREYTIGLHAGGTSKVVRVYTGTGSMLDNGGATFFNRDRYADGPTPTFQTATRGTQTMAVYAHAGY